MSDRFREALVGAFQRMEERQWLFGWLGKVNADTSITFLVPGRKNFLYVSIRNSNGAQSVVPARNDAGVPLEERLPVKLRLEKGVYVIQGRTARSDLGSPTIPPGVNHHNLDYHSDVNAPSPNNLDVLTWDSTPGEWVAAPAQLPAHSLSAHSDVVFGTLADEEVLTYDSGTSKWINAPVGAHSHPYVTDLTYTNAVFVSKQGNDANSGRSPNVPKLTIGAAITAASGLTPSATSRVCVVVLDAATYTENLTMVSHVDLRGAEARLAGTIVVVDNSTIRLREITPASGTGITLLQKTSGSSASYCFIDIIDGRNTTGSWCVRNLASGSVVFVWCTQMFVGETGTGVGDGSAGFGHVHLYCPDLYLAGNSAVGVSGNPNTASIIGYIDHILEFSPGYTGTVGVSVPANGLVHLTCTQIIADTAYTVNATGTLNLVCPDIQGTRTGTPTCELSDQLVKSVQGEFSDDVVMTAVAGELRQDTNAKTLRVIGGTGSTDGPYIELIGKDSAGTTDGNINVVATTESSAVGLIRFYNYNGTVLTEAAQIDTSAGKLAVAIVRALGASGLRLEDDGGNLGLFVEDGGQVGVGTDAPGYALHVYHATDHAQIGIQSATANKRSSIFTINDGTNYIQQIAFGSTDTGTRFGASRVNTGELSSIGLSRLAFGTFDANPVIIGTNNAERVRVDSAGNVGIGTTSPQGRLHSYDGRNGLLQWSTSGLVGSAATIIPNGTGDVTIRVHFLFIVSSGGSVVSDWAALSPSGTLDQPVGGSVWRFAVSAGGTFTVVRQSGTGTATVAVLAFWL